MICWILYPRNCIFIWKRLYLFLDKRSHIFDDIEEILLECWLMLVENIRISSMYTIINLERGFKYNSLLLKLWGSDFIQKS